MSAVLEFGFDAAPAFSGVDRLEQKLNGLNGTVARVSTAHDKLRQALKNPWVSAGIDAQGYLEKMRAVERQERSIATAHQRLTAYKVTGTNHQAPVNPWTTAGSGQYAAQQESAAASAAQQKAAESAALAQQRAASIAAADAARQQRSAEAAAAAQQRSASMAAAAANAAARQETLEAAAQRNRTQSLIDGRLQLQLIEARLSGNARETKQFEQRISQLAQMRQLQSQLGLSQRDAYALSARMAASPHAAAGGGSAGSRGSFALGQSAMQVQDIAVQLQMGTRYSTILAQQGSQILSVFGTGGAVAGGVIAIGGAFLQMADDAKQAFAEAIKGQKEFEQEVAKTIATSNGAELFSTAEKAQDRLKGLKDEFDQMWQKRSAGDVISEVFGGPSFSEKYLAAADRIAATEKIIQGELSRALLESSQQDAQVVMLRTHAREAEADAMERQIKHAREMARLDALNVPADVKTQLKGNAQTKFDATNAAEAAKETKKISDAQAQLDDQKHKAGLDEMTLAKRMATLNVDLQKAAESEARLRSAAAPDALKIVAAESKRITLQSELLNLQKQMTKEKEREAEASKRSAEEAQREAEADAKKNSDRRGAVVDTAMEYRMLQARASGNERAIEQADYQQRVLERANKLEQQNGMERKDALALAIKMADLEDRANGKRGHIHGVTDNADPNMRNGLSGDWKSGPSGNGKYRAMGETSGPLSRNGGLDGFWDLQSGKIGSRTEPSMLYNTQPYDVGKGIQDNHANNAAKDTAGNTGNSQVDAFIEKLISRLPPALADAILAKS